MKSYVERTYNVTMPTIIDRKPTIMWPPDIPPSFDEMGPSKDVMVQSYGGGFESPAETKMMSEWKTKKGLNDIPAEMMPIQAVDMPTFYAFCGKQKSLFINTMCLGRKQGEYRVGKITDMKFEIDGRKLSYEVKIRFCKLPKSTAEPIFSTPISTQIGEKEFSKYWVAFPYSARPEVDYFHKMPGFKVAWHMLYHRVDTFDGESDKPGYPQLDYEKLDTEYVLNMPVTKPLKLMTPWKF